ncbi:MAG TPA: serine/threonine protein kinase, partial [Anaeromyxobacteraceae bacterium]
EVVRHVAAADAARWHMAQGFALQLGALTAEQRAAVDGLAALLAAPPALTPQPLPVPAPLALTTLEQRAAAGPYELLGARPDEGLPEVRERARAVRRELDRLRAELSPEEQTTRLAALLVRVDAAVALLGTPGERLMFDARRGNFQGVAHCVTAGIPASVIEARRQALLAEDPRSVAEAQRHLARAQVATKLGNLPSALAEYTNALRRDPLDLEIHKAYWGLKRQVDAK